MTTSVGRTRPEDYTRHLPETVMSNLDHEINRRVEAVLRSEPRWADYTAWNFWGAVWWDRDAEQFWCEVWQHHEHIATLGGTLEEIMVEASNNWGDE